MERKISRLEISEQQRVMERKLSNDLGFLCILESDKQKIIDNFEKQIGLSANLEDFSKLACSNNVSTLYLLVSKVSFFGLCSKMQIIQIKKLNIKKVVLQFLWFFRLKC